MAGADLGSFEDWPVLPDGVEGVKLMRLPEGVPEAHPELSADTCFVCGNPLPAAEAGEMCWGIPGQGVAHDKCYEPADG